jgi:hypothetical protein
MMQTGTSGSSLRCAISRSLPGLCFSVFADPTGHTEILKGMDFNRLSTTINMVTIKMYSAEAIVERNAWIRGSLGIPNYL